MNLCIVPLLASEEREKRKKSPGDPKTKDAPL
jgi:hypothetical protein